MKTWFCFRRPKLGSKKIPLLGSDLPSPSNKGPSLRKSSLVVKGKVPFDVGEQMERIFVSIELLGHPMLAKLLHQSFEEYGYREGVIRIPCDVLIFQAILESLQLADEVSRPDILYTKDPMPMVWIE